MRKVVLSNRA
jgi:tetratricopeptide (TPR) repeat protein